MNAVPEKLASGWQAELQLRFATPCGSTRTQLAGRQHRGPLVIQRPFHPEGDPCHAYIVHPPGGVVGGDELRIDVQVDAGAHALLTTPAATKFYRCALRRSVQTQELRAAGAALEWLPQENIFYRGADAHTATRVHLDARSRFIGWEIACLGLPARGESFDAGSLQLDFELWRTAPAFIDRLRLTGDSRARGAAWGLAGCEALGTLLATPASDAHLDAIRDLLAGCTHAAASRVDGVLVLRVLAAQAEPIRKLFIRAWRLLRPEVIGREAVPPRIWST
jgi:urease accessory protein